MTQRRIHTCLLFPRDHSYAFDVDPVSERFLNRRVFAYIDAGIPDGLQVDTEGNIYAGTGDGVQVRFPCPFRFAILNGVNHPAK